jgi:Na+/H+-dicarboxylate symporter
MWFAPLGIFGLVAFNIATKGGGAAFGAELAKLSKYVGTVSVGLLIHGAVLCLILWTLGRRNPFRFLVGVARAILTAFTTSSSSATLPITIECVEEQGVSQKAAGFVLPLGATVNMDGTALYEAVAAVFIAQSVGVPLDMGAMFVVFLTATLAAIGAAGIPQAGLVTMVIVLTAVGLPISGIGLILAIDWFLDRLRTSVNVFGDTVGSAVIDRYVDA